MSVTDKDIPPHSTDSFCECAAWVSFVMAILFAVMTGAICIFPLFEGEALLPVYGLLFGGLVISFILGAISLLGFRKHRHKFTLWMAWAGVLFSGGLAGGAIIYFVTLLKGFGHQ